MTIRHLRVFIEVADSGKMSMTASKFFLSQPTVSQIIRELEEHYNVLLFERIAQKLYITEHGRYLLSYARHVVAEFDTLEHAMLQINKTQQLRIGATLTISTCLLPDILTQLTTRLPHLDIFSYSGNTASVEEKLLKSNLDVGLIEGSVKNNELISMPLISDYLVLICSSTHPLAGKKRVTLKDLSNYSFALREAGSGTRTMMESYLTEHHINIDVRWETCDIDSLKTAVMQQNLLTIASVRLFEKEIKNHDVQIFMNGNYEWDRNFHLVYHKKKDISQSISVLHDILIEYGRPEFLADAEYGIVLY
ncbi:HTH-type transcriptional activator CmpR [uncultured Roseburia sp.]|uniref:LysR family transcriptional regulator n=1 Tax=Brotonthovivens ammoniilytica TaxID=2981725 RepID=A0ABT2TJ99_9FIRM|nr:LysR family transcriptional regulator [Brotonthovivens ammoniilytica]MCU6762289.1 LysR family transcriptional regulator [Brotonthovivens ammoniilytica]SCI66804.1 HTH-type transcriptional activator CmpR [uncultured Roseburia sp.]